MEAHIQEHFKTASKVPKDHQMLRLYKEGKKPWSIPLLLYREEIKGIINRKNKATSEEKITLYFPFEGKYYGKKVNKEGGFTLRDLVKGSQKLALKLMTIVAKENPKMFGGQTAEQIVAGYGIFGLKVAGNQIFAVVKHKNNKD